jgi:hypothetical protein
MSSTESSDIAQIAARRGCIPPAPCGRGAGGNGGDLPCDCEAIAEGAFDPLDPCLSCDGRDGNHTAECYFA